MKLIFLLTSILFLFFQVSGQENFYEATVKTADGKTLEGLVKIEKGYCPSVLIFKENQSMAEQTFKPMDIINFSSGGRFYISTFAEIEEDGNFVGKQVFLMLEQSGTKSLYSYKTHDQTNFYIQQDDGFVLLEKNKDKYKTQLADYLVDCKSDLKPMLDTLSYNLRSFQKLFGKYNECYDNLYKVVTLERDTRTRFYLNMGGVRTMLVITDGNFVDAVHFLDMEIVPHYSVTGSVAMNWDFEKGFDNTSFYSSLGYNYSSFTYTGDYELIMNTGYLKTYDGIKLKLCCHTYSPTFILGLSYAYMVNYVNYYNGLYGEEEAIKSKALKKNELGAWIAVGFDFGRFTTLLGYERSAGFSKYPALAIKFNRTFFTIGYKFFEY